MRASITLCSDGAELSQLGAFAEAFARSCGLPDEERARLLIILEELFTNVVAHGYKGRSAAGSVAVGLGWRNGRLTIDFVDDGRPFDPLARAGPDLDMPGQERPIGGLGIRIVRALVDEAHYRREGVRNHLHLMRQVAPGTKNAAPR